MSLDSRDLEEELHELQQRKEEHPKTFKEEDEIRLKELLNLKEEVERSGWDYGIVFIEDYDFEDYAKEYAYDVGLIDRNNPLMNYVDWEEWANYLKNDYMVVEFRGTDYLFREH